MLDDVFKVLVSCDIVWAYQQIKKFKRSEVHVYRGIRGQLRDHRLDDERIATLCFTVRGNTYCTIECIISYALLVARLKDRFDDSRMLLAGFPLAGAGENDWLNSVFMWLRQEHTDSSHSHLEE